jgi:hypothetical protein
MTVFQLRRYLDEPSGHAPLVLVLVHVLLLVHVLVRVTADSTCRLERRSVR